MAGDIVGIAKIDQLSIGSTITAGPDLLIVPPINARADVLAGASSRRAAATSRRSPRVLAKALDEDPTLKTTRDRQTNELVVSGLGDIHLLMLLARLKRRYQLEVDTKPPKIPYRETITAKADGHYRHKKQTGGAGQFGEVYVRVEPRERGAGFEFVDDTFGGSIPKQFMPAVEKGVREALEQGVIAGYPFQDVLVAATDGKSHPVDSKEVAFKIAGRKAFKDAVMKAKPVILEPYVNMAITVPDTYLGTITGDLNSRRGRIVGMETGAGGTQTIKVQVPQAEVAQYNTQLRSITGGQGSYTMELSHYEPVPAHVQQHIIETSVKKKDEDE